MVQSTMKGSKKKKILIRTGIAIAGVLAIYGTIRLIKGQRNKKKLANAIASGYKCSSCLPNKKIVCEKSGANKIAISCTSKLGLW